MSFASHDIPPLLPGSVGEGSAAVRWHLRSLVAWPLLGAAVAVLLSVFVLVFVIFLICLCHLMFVFVSIRFVFVLCEK